jgi:DNA-directed RNA polymerase specialized sigma24 family protein
LDLEEKAKILEYIKEFDKHDKYRAISYCYSWNGTNGRYFNGKDPEDYLMEVLAKMLDGKKCYTASYKAFKGSVYFHLKYEMLSYFHIKEDEINKGKNSELSFTNAESLLNEDLYFESAEIIYTGVEHSELKEQIFSCFDHDTEIEEILVLEEMLKGGKREEISKDLGITPSDYTNIVKRIKSKLIKRNTLINITGN